MPKALFIIFVATMLGLASVSLAHGGEELAAVTAALQEEAVAPQDLGVTEPTLLPSSPFYFFKDLGRGIQRVFTFNPIKRAELELRFADEKLAEAKKVSEVSPERTAVITRAVENYRASQERLKANLERLRETSQNPNVDRLLEKLADRTVKHEKLFDELKQKFAGEAELEQELESSSGAAEETAAAGAKKDDPEKFARKLERALAEAKGSNLRHVRSVEILDRIHNKVDEKLKEKIAGIRQDFAERLKEELEELAAKTGEGAPELIRETLENLPGDPGRRLIILEELRDRAAQGVGGALDQVKDTLERELNERPEKLARRAEEAIQHARERIEKLEARLKEISAIPPAVERLAKEARANLDRARRALEDKKFGEAFGQARAAEVHARNALRILEEEQPEEDEEHRADIKEDMAELEEDLAKWESRIELLAEDLQPRAKEALGQARFHLRLALESLDKGELREAKRHLKEAKAFERLLERIFHAARKIEVRPEPRPESERDGKTETRKRDELERCGPRPLAPGNWVCKEGIWRLIEERKTEEKPMLRIEPAPAPAPVAAEPTPAATAVLSEFKIEADDAGFYPAGAIQVARGSKVTIRFIVREQGVYFGGLDFRSPKFKTEAVKAGSQTQASFSADESFVITSYWPASGVRKADLKVEVQ